uniref:Uncharacterized protein n=1 Tax=Entomoneis paludosa TaxID=265537 RepID=A0A7S3DNT1_9STRA|mmetsp:Transcript_23729/g.49276  ORF Transcript_23729/g.49276 Transcript_23729/m.49276 type:complete len:179 (+) Transcript_23729:108-644(+)
MSPSTRQRWSLRKLSSSSTTNTSPHPKITIQSVSASSHDNEPSRQTLFRKALQRMGMKHVAEQQEHHVASTARRPTAQPKSHHQQDNSLVANDQATQEETMSTMYDDGENTTISSKSMLEGLSLVESILEYEDDGFLARQQRPSRQGDDNIYSTSFWIRSFTACASEELSMTCNGGEK